MPNCFSLTRVGMRTPQRLQEVDNDMRRHFGAEADPERWYENWYNTIGLCIALGHGPDKIRELVQGEGANEVIDWLVCNYEWDTWVSR